MPSRLSPHHVPKCMSCHKAIVVISYCHGSISSTLGLIRRMVVWALWFTVAGLLVRRGWPSLLRRWGSLCHSLVNLDIYIYIFICMYVCIYIYIIYLYIYIRTYTHMHAYMYVYIYNINIYNIFNIYIYIYIYYVWTEETSVCMCCDNDKKSTKFVWWSFVFIQYLIMYIYTCIYYIYKYVFIHLNIYKQPVVESWGLQSC